MPYRAVRSRVDITVAVARTARQKGTPDRANSDPFRALRCGSKFRPPRADRADQGPPSRAMSPSTCQWRKVAPHARPKRNLQRPRRATGSGYGPRWRARAGLYFPPHLFGQALFYPDRRHLSFYLFGYLSSDPFDHILLDLFQRGLASLRILAAVWQLDRNADGQV